MRLGLGEQPTDYDLPTWDPRSLGICLGSHVHIDGKRYLVTGYTEIGYRLTAD